MPLRIWSDADCFKVKAAIKRNIKCILSFGRPLTSGCLMSLAFIEFSPDITRNGGDIVDAQRLSHLRTMIARFHHLAASDQFEAAREYFRYLSARQYRRQISH